MTIPLAGITMAERYDAPLVALSVVIAIAASYAALDLAAHVATARGRGRAAWIVGGALAMGSGIWSMHFTGMLAFSVGDMTVWYDVPAVLVSWLVAIGASALALSTVSRRAVSAATWLASGVCMGLGIAAMHYVGMAAMRMQAAISYKPLVVALSIAIAVAASLAALWLAFRLRGSGRAGRRWMVGGAVVMGIAIAGMHYAGMEAAIFRPADLTPTPYMVQPGPLGAATIAIVTFLILGFALLTGTVDRRMAAQAMEADRLRRDDEERARLLAREQAAHAQAEVARRRVTLLSDVSTALAASLDYAATLDAVARRIVPELADWCVMSVVEEDGSTRRLGMAHRDPSREGLLREIERRYALNAGDDYPTLDVFRSGQSLLVARTTPAFLDAAARDGLHRRMLDELGCTSCIIVPLVARDRVLGTLSLALISEERRFGEVELAVAEEVGRRCAMAVDNGRLYREARDAVRVRDDFLTAASHDLRTPLTAIKGRAELIEMRLESGLGGVSDRDKEWLRKQVDAVSGGAERMLAAVNEISDVARLQMGQRLELHVEALDAGGLVRGIVAAMPGTVPLEVDAPSGITIEGDRTRLERVVQNVVGNAMKYTPDAAPVHIQVLGEGKFAVIRVRDRGVGIPANELPYIFTRFYRASTARSIAGNGIGLSGAKTIVEQHGGHIAVDSAAGQGTTVTITLPRTRPETGPLPPL